MEYEPVKDELMNHNTHLNKQISVSNDLRQKLVNRSLYVWIRILKESSDALNKDFDLKDSNWMCLCKIL